MVKPQPVLPEPTDPAEYAGLVGEQVEAARDEDGDIFWCPHSIAIITHTGGLVAGTGEDEDWWVHASGECGLRAQAMRPKQYRRGH